MGGDLPKGEGPPKRGGRVGAAERWGVARPLPPCGRSSDGDHSTNAPLHHVPWRGKAPLLESQPFRHSYHSTLTEHALTPLLPHLGSCLCLCLCLWSGASAVSRLVTLRLDSPRQLDSAPRSETTDVSRAQGQALLQTRRSEHALRPQAKPLETYPRGTMTSADARARTASPRATDCASARRNTVETEAPQNHPRLQTPTYPRAASPDRPAPQTLTDAAASLHPSLHSHPTYSDPLHMRMRPHRYNRTSPATWPCRSLADL